MASPYTTSAVPKSFAGAFNFVAMASNNTRDGLQPIREEAFSIVCCLQQSCPQKKSIQIHFVDQKSHALHRQVPHLSGYAVRVVYDR